MTEGRRRRDKTQPRYTGTKIIPKTIQQYLNTKSRSGEISAHFIRDNKLVGGGAYVAVSGIVDSRKKVENKCG